MYDRKMGNPKLVVDSIFSHNDFDVVEVRGLGDPPYSQEISNKSNNGNYKVEILGSRRFSQIMSI